MSLHCSNLAFCGDLVEVGYDYEGNDLENVWRKSSKEDCAAWCGVIDGCSYWSHGKLTTTSQTLCYLKTSSAGKRKYGSFVSGEKPCKPGNKLK